MMGFLFIQNLIFSAYVMHSFVSSSSNKHTKPSEPNEFQISCRNLWSTIALSRSLPLIILFPTSSFSSSHRPHSLTSSSFPPSSLFDHLLLLPRHLTSSSSRCEEIAQTAILASVGDGKFSPLSRTLLTASTRWLLAFLCPYRCGLALAFDLLPSGADKVSCVLFQLKNPTHKRLCVAVMVSAKLSNESCNDSQ